MAEVFAVATGAFSIVGFAGQLAQSAAFLYAFIGDIKGAPKRVQALGEELRILSSLLADIQKSYTGQNTDLEQTLKQCQQCLHKLLAFVKKVDPKQYAKKRRRLWSQFKVALKGSELTSYLEELDRSKSMLLQACANILRVGQTSHSNKLETVVENSNNLLNTQHVFNNSTREIQTTVNEIKDTSSNLSSTTGRVVAITSETQTKIDELSHRTEEVQNMTERIELATQTLDKIRETSSILSSTTARVVAIAGETQTKIDELSYNTEDVRNMIERIELATQTLVNENLANQPMILEAFKNEVSRTISRILKRHLVQHFGPPNANRMQIPPGDDKVGFDQLSRNNEIVPESQNCYPGNQDIICSRTRLEDLAGKWIKQSLIQNQRILVRNTTFGTIFIHTQIVTYTREVGNTHLETKQVSNTTLTLLPASWLTSRGAVLRHQKQDFSTCAGYQSIPHWSLSTVNIIKEDSEIEIACSRHDLDTIRKLFDEGRASPYDVDCAGRNLLGFVAVGVQFLLYPGKHETLQRRLDDLDAIIALLIELGVDSGCLDLHEGNPITLAAVRWSDAKSETDITSSQEDHFNFLLKKLLMSAKTDPFGGSDAFVLVSPNGEYRLYDFPGFVDPDETVKISTLQLELLIGQNEWQITLDQRQLDELYSARWLHFSNYVPHVRSHVDFWVTSRAEDVEKYLDTKLGLMRRFLDRDLFNLEPGADHCIIAAVDTACEQGGEVIALLTEHTQFGASRQPWIRHRFRKLVLVERWLTEVIQLLLTSCNTLLPLRIVESRYNARTHHAWMSALGACTKYQPRLSELQMNANNGKAVGSGNPKKQDSDVEWETDETEDTESNASDWETEEEWEEGYMYERAVDRDHSDARNPDISDEDRYPDANPDYDEKYWHHVYPCIMGLNLDNGSPESRESVLQRLGRYVKDFLALGS